jgi:ElaB/YqjD/DUF883 family membrane-anchored ribosome-binding protein
LLDEVSRVRQSSKEGSVSVYEDHQAGSGGLSEKAQEVAAEAKEQAREKADEVKARASDRVRGQLDTRSTEVADQMTAFVQALHKAGDHLQGQGNMSGSKAAHRLGDQVERLADYLRGSGSDRFLGDIESFARRRPWAAGGIGVAAGFMAARFMKASSESRYSSVQASYVDGGARDLPLQRDTAPALPAAARTDAW